MFRGHFVFKQLAHWNDQELVGRTGRSLRRRIEAPQRLDHVADKFQAHRLRIARRKNVDDAAADGKRAVFLDRVFAREACIDKQISKVLRIDLGSGSNLERRTQQPLRPADAREQRCRGGNNQPRRASGGAVERTSAGGRHSEMRRHAAIGIDLERWQRKHCAFDVRV